MKLSNKIFFAFLFLSLVSQLGFSMKTEPKTDDDEMGKIIFIAGISTSGKSAIAEELFEKLQKNHPNKIKMVAQDKFDDAAVKKEEANKEAEESSKLEAEQRLAITKAKEFALDGYIVICDLVPLNGYDELIFDEIINQTQIYPTYKVFVHTPYKQIIQQVKRRNDLATSKEEKRSPYGVMMQFAKSYTNADGTKSPQNIPDRMSSPELEEQCKALTPPQSPLLKDRLFGAIEKNLFPNNKQETFCIKPIQNFDHIFQNNNFDAKTGKPSPAKIKVLVFAVEEWLKTATAEWEKALDADQKSDDDIFDDYEDAKLADYSDDDAIFDYSDDKADKKVSSSSSSQQKQ